MNAPVTVTLSPFAQIVALNMISVRLDSLTRWRAERVNTGLTVTGLDSQIAELRAMRAQIAPPKRREAEAGSRLDANIARVRAALEAAE